MGGLIARVPIVQGGMGVGVSLSNLAGSVAALGGVGVLSAAQIGYLEEDYNRNPVQTNLQAIGKYVKKAREIANGGVIGINIMVATKFYEEYVKAAVQAGVDIIISGAGLPSKLPELVGNTQTKMAPIVSSIKSSRVICKFWDKHYNKTPDMVVIEGPLAGGHLGFSMEQLETMTPEQFDKEVVGIIQVVEEYRKKYEKEIPVVVAGGVYERADMEHYLALGADGVQIGTRFVTTYECDAADQYKQAYIHAQKEDIRIVKSPVGMPGRAVSNEFIKKTETETFKLGVCHQCISTCNQKDIPYCIAEALIHAAKGEVENGLVFCGSNAYRATKLEHVKDIFEEFQSIS